QSQFMPSSFLNYAVDYDGDGKRDIWTTKADVFGSAANYLSGSGWRSGETWGREASLPAGFDPTLISMDVAKPLAAWQALGVRRADGRNLPAADLMASLVLPGGEGGPVFLVYENYRTILKWNRSHYFAMAVGHLANAIGASSAKSAP
ncbi:MAG: lytic murein transglycosylase, partial [Alphaproteobacteria bacterium]|nr:lytic murein transglycosylase [Alphaproteobacteria bacterium]